MRSLLPLLCALMLLSVTAAAQEPPAADSDAAAYAAWADTQVGSADAALNAGLKYAEEDRLGLALVYLERARLAAPLDREVEDALQTVAREARHRRAEEASDDTLTEGEPSRMTWFRFFHILRPAAYRWTLFATVWATCLLFLLWRRLARSVVRDGVLVSSVLMGIAAGSAAFFTAGAAWTESTVRPAIVVAAAPLYREAPDELSPQRRHADLYEGAVVRVLERRDEEWVHIEVAGDESLWVSPQTLVEITPPR